MHNLSDEALCERWVENPYFQYFCGEVVFRHELPRDGDRINAVLAAAGYNFSLLLRWFEELLRVLSLILWRALLATPLHLTRCRKTFFTAD